MRLSLIEALCLVAIGATMVELHDGRRLARPGVPAAPALATAAKAASAADEVRPIETANSMSNPGYR